MTIKATSKRTRSILIITILGLAIIGASCTVWWRRVYTEPANVFNRMLGNALSTTSVSKNSLVEGEGQSLSQVTDVFFAPEPRVHGLVKISQTGEQSSSVRRETLTTNNESFVRLISIDTTQKNMAGQPFDFSSVTGIWGRTPVDETSNSLSQLFGQNAIVPFANLSTYQRKLLLDQMNKDGVYEVDYKNMKYTSQNGRSVYEYPVNVNQEAFIKMMKTLSKMVGVNAFDQVSTDDYKNLPKASFSFSVDVLSGDLTKVDYGKGQIENYNGFGIRTFPANPKNSITISELQERLQKLQQ